MSHPTGAEGEQGSTSGGRTRRSGTFGHEWSTEEAAAIARAAGIARLGDRHWRAITSCREEAVRIGRLPSLKSIEGITGFGTEELRVLFPGDPRTTIGRIAGLLTRRARSRRAAPRPDKE